MPVGLGAAAYACLYSRTSKREDLKIRYDMLLARSQLPHSLRRPLPPCEGPNLSAFKRGGLAIHFIKLLSSSPRLDGSEGAEGSHSYVFKVRIGKKKYALKVFKFFSVEHERSSVFPTDKSVEHTESCKPMSKSRKENEQETRGGNIGNIDTDYVCGGIKT
ncbi:hypothetical protein EJ05DRAFT_515655 [Pseudovirgaria hyperparasitica]|uniref:Uncharacterized protein n=1 Tax=Pseudovirgaria hyperparasitica TaxID=470096 RepID=A0A6A6VRN7_9PEZI|nr:uncharacterized protein EJ05DRAFT_515655 [Pseudovirgaria hyperparasitica]KAF2752424.1 hypothetical protein EJ05DRAFT_515655 [Pseudovirgaria hyperparasitica]